MSIWDRVRELMSRAKDGAADVAQVANLKLDIRGLEGRRDHLLRDLGRKALAMHVEGRGVPELAVGCEEIGQVERRIKDKQAELEVVRSPAPEAQRNEAPVG